MPSPLVRRFVASYFNVGDLILYGKYKNKKGRILEFSHDPKGNPTITIEPIPKGRKQNKLIGLFKIWKAPIDKQAATRVNPNMTLRDARKGKSQLFASLSPGELEALRLLERKSVMGRPGTASVAIPQRKGDPEMRPLGLEITRLVKAGWARFSEGPTRDGFGNFHLTTAAENLLRAFGEGSDPLLKQGQTMTDNKKVVVRFIKAYGLEVGRKFEIGSVRFHRFADHFKVWDLTNAGKRGKKVQLMVITPPNTGGTEKAAWMDRMGQAIVDHDSYAEVKRFLKDLDSDRPGEIGIRETEERGVDVNPGGTTPIQIETNTGLIVSADPLKFNVLQRTDHVGPKGNKFKMDTNYFPVGRLDAAPFYNWLKANLSEANKLDLEGYQKLWDSLGIRWDSH